MEASALHAPAGLGRRTVATPLLRLRSDEQLVALFRAGNEDAFGIIHDRYRQRLFAYTRQMLAGSRSDAEDAMQDVFLRAYRALRVDERPVSLRAWLYRVAHNRCIDQLRRPVPAPADVFDLSRTPLLDPMDAAERREDLARLVADVRRLPEQQRSALLMRELDGLSYAELAAALDTSVPAVKSLLVRARVGLVEAIEARDADCADIRHDLAAAYDRGVRASGRAKRHLRECHGCTTYRAQLVEVRRGFGALHPGAAAPHVLAKLLGLGGASSGAAGAAAGGGGAAAVTGAATVSVGKVAAIVCCAAALTGGAAHEVHHFTGAGAAEGTASERSAAAAAVAAGVAGAQDAAALRHALAVRDSGPALTAPGHPALAVSADEPLTAPLDVAPWEPPAATHEDATVHASGGVAAPEEPTGQGTATGDGATAEDPGLLGTLLPGAGKGASEPETGSGPSSASNGSSTSSPGSSSTPASSSSTGTADAGAPSGGTAPSSSSSASATPPTATSASSSSAPPAGGGAAP